MKAMHRALDFDGEVDVARGVDDVDAVLGKIAGHALPEGGGRGRGDRDAAFLFLLHPVHRGGAVVHLADLVIDAGVEQDALGGGRFAGIDVGTDADVAVTLDRGLTAHHNLLWIWKTYLNASFRFSIPRHPAHFAWRTCARPAVPHNVARIVRSRLPRLSRHSTATCRGTGAGSAG
jgi:hypothetical protein